MLKHQFLVCSYFISLLFTLSPYLLLYLPAFYFISLLLKPVDLNFVDIKVQRIAYHCTPNSFKNCFCDVKDDLTLFRKKSFIKFLSLEMTHATTTLGRSNGDILRLLSFAALTRQSQYIPV